MESTIAATPVPSRAKTIAYWVITGFIAFELVYGALWDFNVLNKSYVYTVLAHLSYPAYLATLLGVCKLPAALVLLIPGLPRLKEWAYAGVVTIFGGAVFSHAAVGDGLAQIIWPLAFGLLTLASWALRPASRRLAFQPSPAAAAR